MTDLPNTAAQPMRPPLQRGGALDALRFFAAGFFVLYHYELHAPAAFATIHPGLARGYLGTDFFLILSGYVLGRTYGPRVEAGGVTTAGFFIKRYARLWPPYILVLAAIVAMTLAASVVGEAAHNPEGFDFASLPGHVLLVQAWGLGFKQGWNTPTWTLSALVFCYLLFPTLWRAIARVRGAGVLAIGAAGIAVADLITRAMGHTYYDIDPAYGVLRAVPLFVLGCVVARYVPPPAVQRRAPLLWPLAAMSVFAVQAFGRFDFLSMMAIAATVLLAGAAVPKRASPLVAQAGQLSFALYLTHTLAGIFWYRALGKVVTLGDLTGPVAWAAWASAFPFAVVVAFGFHKLVESPLKSWSDGLFQRRPRPQALPA